MSSELHWLRYRSTTKALVWHAWRQGESSSVCGYLRSSAQTTKRIRARSNDAPSTREHICTTCQRRLGMEVTKCPEEARAITRHVNQSTCACNECREGRKEAAERFATTVEEQVQKIACECVKEAVRMAPETRILAEEAEQRFRYRLLLWEMNGGDQARVEASGGRTLLLDIWHILSIKFEKEGNSHQCRSEMGGNRK